MTRAQKQLLIKLALVAVVLLAGAVLLLRGVDLRALIEGMLAFLREAGPWMFFAAMALLPAAGFPLSIFALTAGSAFGAEYGMGTVMVAGLLALAFNLTLTYWLATKALRPLLAHLLQRFGYQLPQVASADMTDLIVILRVTPGPPFFVQSYLLGLARAPFGKYFTLSMVINGSYLIAMILFGDALLHGKGKMVLLGIAAILSLTALTHLLRRHYGKKVRKS